MPKASLPHIKRLIAYSLTSEREHKDENGFFAIIYLCSPDGHAGSALLALLHGLFVNTIIEVLL